MRFTIRSALATALCAYSACTVGADLVGKVRDAHGNPRAGVEVRLTGPAERTTTTTNAGDFVFPGIPSGSYGLSCTGGQSITLQVGAGTIRRDLNC
jgi:carboxypeptidase family protein